MVFSAFSESFRSSDAVVAVENLRFYVVSRQWLKPLPESRKGADGDLLISVVFG